LPNAVTAAAAVEVSTAAAVLVAAVFMAVVGLAVAIMAEVTATAVIAVAGGCVRCTEAAGTVGWAAVRRRAALEEEVGPRVGAADGPAGVGIEGTFRTLLLTGNGTLSELVAAGLELRGLVASAELRIGAEAMADAALVGVAVLGVIVASAGEGAGAVAGDLALAPG